jgi:maltose-binding protein MalE
MDAERGRSLEAITQKFRDQFGINVRVETPENITDSFPTAAQCGKGPDMVIWAHDKVGEWADAGLISTVNVPDQFRAKYFAKGWEAVRHKNQIWGFPIGLETVALIYNKKLLDGPPPKSLADLLDLSEAIKVRHPGVLAFSGITRAPITLGESSRRLSGLWHAILTGLAQIRTLPRNSSRTSCFPKQV